MLDLLEYSGYFHNRQEAVLYSFFSSAVFQTALAVIVNSVIFNQGIGAIHDEYAPMAIVGKLVVSNNTASILKNGDT